MDTEKGRPAAASTCSPAVMKLIEEIKREGRGQKPKPKKPQPKNYLKDNVKFIRDLQKDVKQKEKQQNSLKAAKPKPFHGKKSHKEETDVLSSRTEGQSCQEHQFRSHSSCSACHPVKLPQKPVTPHPLGYIPVYVTKHKKLLEEEAKEIEEEERAARANIPPGHSLLSEEDRLETLDLLIENKEELLKLMRFLPLQIETRRAKRQKEELESKLAKVEEGILLFSRPRVFIKNDS